MSTAGEYELRFVQAGIDQLETYLLSSELYLPPGISAPKGKSPYPQLTLGNLLLAEKKALAATLNTPLYPAAQECLQFINEIKEKWLVHWNQKCYRELNSRILLWKEFINAYVKDSQNNYDRYRFEVNRRVLIAIISEQIDPTGMEAYTLIKSLDLILRSNFEHGIFIWNPIFVAAFPEENYWYLYGELPKILKSSNHKKSLT